MDSRSTIGRGHRVICPCKIAWIQGSTFHCNNLTIPPFLFLSLPLTPSLPLFLPLSLQALIKWPQASLSWSWIPQRLELSWLWLIKEESTILPSCRVKSWDRVLKPNCNTFLWLLLIYVLIYLCMKSVELLTEQTNKTRSLSLNVPGLTPFPHWTLIPRMASEVTCMWCHMPQTWLVWHASMPKVGEVCTFTFSYTCLSWLTTPIYCFLWPFFPFMEVIACIFKV